MRTENGGGIVDEHKEVGMDDVKSGYSSTFDETDDVFKLTDANTVTVLTIEENTRSGSVSFWLPDGTESLRIDPDGKFFVRGKEVAEDVEVYEAMKQFLFACGMGFDGKGS